MALKADSFSASDDLSIKVVGDLGDIQITELSDSESDNEEDKQNKLQTISNLPANLVKKTSVPVFESFAVTNSSNVQVGNNTYFNGPVTIKQVIHNKSGIENPAFQSKECNGADLPHQSKLDDSTLKSDQILVWHKLTFSAICISVVGGIIALVLVLQNKTEDQSTNVAQADSTHDSSPNTTVAGYCYENSIPIFISIILFPLTFVLIFYPLLTKEVTSNRIIQKKIVHESCVIKGCTICNEEADPLLADPEVVRIVSRTDWLAQPVEGELDKLALPVPWVIIAHTATESCSTQSQCVLRVRLIQTFHIESRNWDDIGYNFLVGGDGSVYFGRGWDYEGAHTRYYNRYSIGIAFIGTFNTDIPPKQQVEACKKIIRQGVQLGKIAKDYKLLAHRQLMSTLSPGDKIVEIIKEWPHYVTNDTDVRALLPSTGVTG